MNTLFELKQTGKSFGEDCITEIKINEDGSLVYTIIDDNMMEDRTEEKSVNHELAKQISDLLIRNQRILNEIESELNNRCMGYLHEIKFGDKQFYGYELRKIIDEKDIVDNAEAEDSIVRLICIVRKYIDKFYPDFIDWDAISTQWFRKNKISNFSLDDDYYTVIDDKVFVYSEEGELIPEKNVTVNQLKMYGKCSDPWLLELKITSIKTYEAPDWKALITGEDGAGIEISFWDDSYFDHPENYEIGKIGSYNLWADIQNSPKPIRQKQGLYLEESEDDLYVDFICGEKNIHGQKKGKKYISYLDFALFNKCDNFKESGLYNFRTVVGTVYYNSDENGDLDENSTMGFEIPLMNQILKEYPRRISAQFDLDNPYIGEFEIGDGLTGVIRFCVTENVGENIGKYGQNDDLSYDEKYPDTSEFDDED